MLPLIYTTDQTHATRNAFKKLIKIEMKLMRLYKIIASIVTLISCEKSPTNYYKSKYVLRLLEGQTIPSVILEPVQAI